MRKIVLALAVIASVALTGCGVAKVAGYCVTHPAECN